MTISMFSFIMGIVWFNIGIIFIYLFRRSNLYIHLYGIRMLMFLVFGCLFRMLLAFEFPSVRVIQSDEIYPWLLNKLSNPVVSVNNGSLLLNFIDIFKIISLSGSILLFVRSTARYMKFRKGIMEIRQTVPTKVMDIYVKELNELSAHHSPILMQSPLISSPYIMGFFKPVILLPDKEFSELEWTYILKHEITHYRGHDMWIKLIVHYICILFWWNPFSYLLKKDLGQILEIKCDAKVCENVKDYEGIEYLRSIIKVMKLGYSTLNDNYYSSAMVKSSNNYMIQRFDIVLNGYCKKKRKKVSVMMLSIFALLFLLSYTFIFQPHYAPSLSAEEGVIVIDSENAYIIYEGNDIYNLYLNDDFYRKLGKEEVKSFKIQGVKVLYQ